MTRRAIPESEKRRTIAFTLSGKDIARIDKYIEEFNARFPFVVMTRQNFLEGYILTTLQELEEQDEE